VTTRFPPRWTPGAAAWRHVYVPRPEAPVRVYCFPHGGCGASAFRPWASALPPDVEVRAVQWPGRQERAAEEPIADSALLARALVDALGQEWEEGPYAFFGHCVGALVAYRTVLEVVRRGGRAPALLVASAFSPSAAAGLAGAFADRCDVDLVEILTVWGTPPEILADPDLCGIVLAGFRGDIGVWRSFVREMNGAVPAVPCPVVGYAGETDHLVPPAELAGWAGLTGCFLGVRTFPGSHVFPHTAHEAVTTCVGRDIRTALRGRGRPG
jgi:surfactin synthase thioesterase subunit